MLTELLIFQNDEQMAQPSLHDTIVNREQQQVRSERHFNSHRAPFPPLIPSSL